VQHLSMKMPFKFKTLKTYDCPKCGTPVNVIQIVRNGEEVKVDKCLCCDNKRLQDDCNEYYRDHEIRKAQSLFNKFSLITNDVEQATFDNYDPKNEDQRLAKIGCVWYVENFHDLNKGFQSMLFQGSYGLGKSHLARAICYSLKETGVSAIYVNVPELLSMIKGTFKKDSKNSEIELLDALNKVKLLVLDDIGAEYVKADGVESWATDKLFQIINSRVGKPTIYTTNYNSGDLTKKYGVHGGRIVSRMMQRTKVMKFSGKDHRMGDF